MANDTDNHTLVSWQSGPKTRGGYSIIWSCLALIITCTWTALHLNVPGIHDSPRAQLFRKIKWMFVMIVFPELVFSHAVVELMTAYSDYQRMWKQKEQLLQLGWCIHQSRGTVWIALLLQRRPVWPWNLGRATQVNTDVGLVLVDAPASEDKSVNTRKQPTRIDPESSQLLRDISRRDCKVHNSCTWTLTHSFYVNMGGLIGKLGDDKGFLCTATHLRLSGPRGNLNLGQNQFTRAEIMDKNKGDVFVRLLWLLQIFRLLLDLSMRRYREYPISPFEIMTASFAALSFGTVIILIKKPLDVRTPIYLEGAEHFWDSPYIENWKSFTRVFFSGEVWSGHSPINRRANDSYRYGNWQEDLLFSMLFLSTLTFGLIHCAAWNYAFPSVVEKWIWRVSALSGIVMPIIALIFAKSLWTLDYPYIFYSSNSRLSDGYRYERKLRQRIAKTRAVNAFQVVSLALHLSSRIALIVVALMSFRSAPRGIYLDTWAAFIPTLQ